jgi:hypothetical protein
MVDLGLFASVAFDANPSEARFFQLPAPFYDRALTTFTNTSSEVTFFAEGARVHQGVGMLNFAAPRPDAETCALADRGANVFGSRRQKRN